MVSSFLLLFVMFEFRPSSLAGARVFKLPTGVSRAPEPSENDSKAPGRCKRVKGSAFTWGCLEMGQVARLKKKVQKQKMA